MEKGTKDKLQAPSLKDDGNNHETLFTTRLQVLLDFPAQRQTRDFSHRCSSLPRSHRRARHTSLHKLVCMFLVCIFSLARLKPPQGKKWLQKYFCKARVLQCSVAAWMGGKFEGVMDTCVGWEEPLEKEVTTHSSSSLGNPKDRGAGRLQLMRLQRVGHNLATKTTTNQDTCVCAVSPFAIHQKLSQHC